MADAAAGLDTVITCFGCALIFIIAIVAMAAFALGTLLL